MNQSKTLLIPFGLIFIVVIGIIVSYQLGFSQGLERGVLIGEKQAETKYEENLKSSRARLNVNMAVGKITEIQGDTLLVEFNLPSDNPFKPEAKKEIKKVKIGENTEILKQVQKTSEEIKREIDEQKAGTAILVPSPFKEVSASLSELKVNANIQVESDENILEVNEFEAVKIVVLFPL